MKDATHFIIVSKLIYGDKFNCINSPVYEIDKFLYHTRNKMPDYNIIAIWKIKPITLKEVLQKGWDAYLSTQAVGREKRNQDNVPDSYLYNVQLNGNYGD